MEHRNARMTGCSHDAAVSQEETQSSRAGLRLREIIKKTP